MICCQWVCRVRRAVEIWRWNLLGWKAIQTTLLSLTAHCWMRCKRRFVQRSLDGVVIGATDEAWSSVIAHRIAISSILRLLICRACRSLCAIGPSPYSTVSAFSRRQEQRATRATPHIPRESRPTACIDAMELIVVCLASLVCTTGPPSSAPVSDDHQRGPSVPSSLYIGRSTSSRVHLVLLCFVPGVRVSLTHHLEALLSQLLRLIPIVH